MNILGLIRQDRTCTQLYKRGMILGMFKSHEAVVDSLDDLRAEYQRLEIDGVVNPNQISQGR